MSLFDDEQLEELIYRILREAEYRKPEHHLGRPFMTSYQIAIKIKERNPDLFLVISKGQEGVGGKGHGEHYSAAQYLAKMLSQRIKKKGTAYKVEGGFLSHEYVQQLIYNDIPVVEAGLGSHDISIFRLRDKAGGSI